MLVNNYENSEVIERGTTRQRTVAVRETTTGFVVQEMPGALNVEMIAEAVLKYFALTLILIAGAIWMLPSGQFEIGSIYMIALLSGCFGLVGFALFTHANRGFKSELQVDASHRELRLATRNNRGVPSFRFKTRMRDVEAVFLRRYQRSDRPAQLCIRTRSGRHPVILIAGPESDLEPALERIMVALKPKVRKVDTKALVAA